MTLRELESRIALREGKKSQVKIGDIREIIRILKDEISKDPLTVLRLLMAKPQPSRTKPPWVKQ